MQKDEFRRRNKLSESLILSNPNSVFCLLYSVFCLYAQISASVGTFLSGMVLPIRDTFMRCL